MISLLLLFLSLLHLTFPLTLSAPDRVYAKIYTDRPTSPPISPHYIGFSLEHDLATTWTGLSHTRPSFVTLISQLSPLPSGPLFRIGGNSADYSLYNPNNLPLPNTTTGFPFTWSINDTQIEALRRGVEAVKGQLAFGLNFRNSTNASHAIEHAKAINRIIGWKNPVLLGLEIGNEPDLYGGNGNRKSSYTLTQFYVEFAEYVTQIREAIPSLPKHFFQGGIYCCAQSWINGIADFVSRFSDEIWGAGVHHYPYAACDPKTTPHLSDLLIDEASTKLAKSLTQSTSGNLIQKVNALGYNLSLSEGNSVACSGAPGVSNTLGSNLWVVDELYNSAQAGLSHWIFHSHDTNTSHYPPLIWLNGDASDVPTVQPEWYALLFFSMATRDNSRIVNWEGGSSNHFIKVWPSVDARGIIRVAILHKDLNATSNATVTLDLSASVHTAVTADVIRLTGPTAYSTYGLDFAGLTFDGTKDGQPSGEVKVERIKPSEGLYSVDVSPISLVMFILNPTGEPVEHFHFPYHKLERRLDSGEHRQRKREARTLQA